MWKVSTADKLVGGLSAPGKMPCKSFSISAFLCQTGGRLSKILGSVCAMCYARKGRYMFANVQAALARRMTVLARALADPVFRGEFISAMSYLIARSPLTVGHPSHASGTKATGRSGRTSPK